jgi:hypothetical protein
MIVEPSIRRRMHNIQVRMRMERISGISAEEKDAFLAFCREQEQSGLVALAADPESEEEVDWEEWEDFGNWHDAPSVLMARMR